MRLRFRGYTVPNSALESKENVVVDPSPVPALNT